MQAGAAAQTWLIQLTSFLSYTPGPCPLGQDASVAVRKKALKLVPVLASLGPLDKALMDGIFQRFADAEETVKVRLTGAGYCNLIAFHAH